MVETIFKANEEFFKDMVGLDLQDGKILSSNNLLISSIEVSKDDKKDIIYLAMQKDTLKKVALEYMMEENLNDEELIDFLNELLNIIAGSAKVKIEKDEKNIEYHLSTPNFLKNKTSIKDLKLDKKKIYKLFGRCYAIGLKNENIR